MKDEGPGSHAGVLSVYPPGCVAGIFCSWLSVAGCQMFIVAGRFLPVLQPSMT